MRVSGQLKEASLENLAADPSNKPNGRIWYDSATNKIKAVVNNTVLQVFTLADLITTAMIGDSQVTTPKIADGAVTSAKIADGTIVTADLANGAVTTDKLADGSVTAAKIAGLGSLINVVSSTGTGGFATYTGTDQEIIGLTLTITTLGKPVLLRLEGQRIGASSGSAGLNTRVKIQRDGVTIQDSTLISANMAGSGAAYFDLPPSVVSKLDTAAVAGAHTYRVLAYCQGGSTLSLTDVKLIASEM